MQTPQTIAIIGAAALGRGIARGLRHGRDKVILCDADFDETESFIRELQAQHPQFDVEALHCSYEATWEADIIILALASCPDRQAIAKKINTVANQKVVIITDDTINELQQLLPHTHIVRAFYNLDADILQQPFAPRQNRDCLISGTDADAVQTVAELVKTMGLQPVIASEAVI